ncbi:hypothetical protein I4U23_008280 [Adineta vaga]|nr:hypothetical protein I4U23_008280 [Adineta vaga]
MVDDTTVTLLKEKTFRFGSGEILTLTEEQIEKIPYVATLVSAADNFVSLYDNDGYYKLDPLIQFKYFPAILESFTFDSIRQLFTHLSKENDIISVIDHLDFLGMIFHPDPTLEEVDTTFFSTIVYSPMLEKDIQIIRPSVLQDMAVQFAVAMIKEEYDFTKNHVIDQIYWFIMFILSAHKFFGPCLRHHVYKIAEYCFSTYQPSLLKSLNKLMHEVQMNITSVNGFLSEYEIDTTTVIQNVYPLDNEEDSDFNQFGRWRRFFRRSYPTLEDRQNLLLRRSYNDHTIFPRFLKSNEENLLEPIHKRVQEIIYERLSVCKFDLKKLHEYSSLSGILSWYQWNHPVQVTEDSEYLQKKIRRDILNNTFNKKSVRKEIRECVQEELLILASELQEKHDKLIKEISEIASASEIRHDEEWYYDYYSLLDSRTSPFERKQEEALCYALLLDKIHRNSTVVNELSDRVHSSLCQVALEQTVKCLRTQMEICKLRQQLSLYPPAFEKNPLTSSESKHHNYRIAKKKSLPKNQLKYSKR